MAMAPPGPPEPLFHSVTGSVTADSQGAAGGTVAAFSADTLELVEVVTVDGLGAYVFSGLPDAVHLFARGAEGSNRAGSWEFNIDLTAVQTVDFQLKLGAPITVRAVDPSGAPVAGGATPAAAPSRVARSVVAHTRMAAPHAAVRRP